MPFLCSDQQPCMWFGLSLASTFQSRTENKSFPREGWSRWRRRTTASPMKETEAAGDICSLEMLKDGHNAVFKDRGAVLDEIDSRYSLWFQRTDTRLIYIRGGGRLFNLSRQNFLTIYYIIRNGRQGTSLVIQWLRPCAVNAGGPGLFPGQETRSHMPQLRLSAAK